MRKCLIKLALALLVLLPGPAGAHFLVLKPSSDTVDSPGRLSLTFRFTHPMHPGGDMPFEVERAGVLFRGKVLPLRWKRRGLAYTAGFDIRTPGVYQFFVVSSPYFEPAEGRFIKQFAKVYVSAFGLEAGWDAPAGFDVEIVPLVRTFGLWQGCTFTGRVLVKGKPAGGVRVEVEYLNERKIELSGSAFSTLVLKTDEDGYFSFTFPWSGWWGFSAVVERGTLFKGGREYPVELGGVLWVKVYPVPAEVR
jgi:cobalt/nickel transport protein